VADVDGGGGDVQRRDDPDGAAQFIERHGDDLYRLALRITGVSEDAEAAIEDALRAIASTADASESESAFAARIRRAVASAAHQKLRERRRRVEEVALERVVPSLDADGHFEPMDDWAARIDARPVDGRLHGVLMEALELLPADDRTALILHDVEGATPPDIAAILGVDVPAVKSRVHRARLVLRKHLSEYFDSTGVAR
jgi:RNA polymerase sigma-70 factor (ECF subfamily)